MKKRFWIGMVLIVTLLSGCGSSGSSDEDVENQYLKEEISAVTPTTIEAQQGNRKILEFNVSDMSVTNITAVNGIVEKYAENKYYYDSPLIGNSDTLTVDYINSLGDTKKTVYNVNLKNKVTFLIYLSSENSLGTDNYNTDDLEEISKVTMEKNNRNVNVVVYVDTVSEKITSNIGNGCYYYTGVSTDTIIVNGETLTGFKKTEYYGTGNTGTASELTGFINYVKENFQSEKYVLDLWSHGDGWLPSSYSTTKSTKQICLDEGDKSSLDMWEVESAISGSEIPKMDVIYTDACLMGGIEVAYQLKDVSDYLVFSPELTPGPGGEYQGIIERINSDYSSGKAISAAIVDANDEFYKDYSEEYTSMGKKIKYNYSYVFTAVDQSKLTDLVSAVQAAYGELLETGNSSLLSKIKANKSSVLCYSYEIINYKEEYNVNTIYADLGSFWSLVETEMNSTTPTTGLAGKIDAVQSALEDYIIVKKYGDGKEYVNGVLTSTEVEEGTSGLSIYTDLVYLNGASEYSKYKTATTFGAISWWQEFLNKFYGI